MTTYTIRDIERAINYWRERDQTGEDQALCAPARALAKPYTQMILEHREDIDESMLTAEQGAAIRDALSFLDARPPE